MTRILLVLLFCLIGARAEAHEVRPALLEIARAPEQTCRIQWKQPAVGTLAVRLEPHLSGGWIEGAAESDVLAPGYRIMRWTKPECTTAALEAQSFKVDGLDATITDVLVRIDYGDGDIRHHLMRPGDPPLSFGRTGVQFHAAAAYFRLGVEHILEGYDHLAFVFGLILLIGLRARLLVAVTGFTVAHSLTLGATALGIFRPWPMFIETLVALSILFVAAEALRARKGRSSLTTRWPEIVALGFGLLHGFAFAGALSEIGLPQGETLLALLLFNLGVEAGQLIFIAAVLTLGVVARPLLVRLPDWSWRVPAYAIGAAAGFWFIERATALFT